MVPPVFVSYIEVLVARQRLSPKTTIMLLTRSTRKTLVPRHYADFRAYLRRHCGILLGDDKQYLVLSRLGRTMTRHEISDFGELVRRLEQSVNSDLQEQVIDALTTNDSLWFRDSYPFEFLRQRVLPELAQVPAGRARIWSAACAFGQEPYSISMLVEETQAMRRGEVVRRVEIIATDISPTNLAYCRNGEYDSAPALTGLTNERLRRHFDQTESGWVIAPNLREHVYFQQHNLLDSYSYIGMFDVIFCRNVLLYFSDALKIDILKRMHGALKSGGYLFLGAAETLPDLGEYYTVENCNPGVVYRAR